MNTNLKMIEISSLVNVPFSNLNRDEAGQPKEGTFGGVDRACLSSQSQKFVVRRHEDVKKLADKISTSLRTSYIENYVYAYLEGKNVELAEDMKLAIKNLCKTLGKARAKDKETLVQYDKDTDTYILPEGNKGKEPSKSNDDNRMILVYSKEIVDFICETIEKMIETVNSDAKLFTLFTNKNVFERSKFNTIRTISLDTALFGSMSASDAMPTIPASVKVARAFSTNAIVRESDFYIAADDFVLDNPNLASGAANMGNLAFNSSCFYKYSVMDLDILKANLATVENLDEVLPDIILYVTKILSLTLPEGKQATNAAYAMPSAICVTLKGNKVPCTYANAFEQPIEGDKNNSLTQKSIDALVNEIDLMDSIYDLNVIDRLWFNCRSDKAPKLATKCNSYNEIEEKLKSYL